MMPADLDKVKPSTKRNVPSRDTNRPPRSKSANPARFSSLSADKLAAYRAAGKSVREQVKHESNLLGVTKICWFSVILYRGSCHRREFITASPGITRRITNILAQYYFRFNTDRQVFYKSK
jgi:hypothetical protein